MKPSLFNVYFRVADRGGVGVYNTWTGRAALLPADTSASPKALDEIGAEWLCCTQGPSRLRMASAGLLVPLSMDEFQAFDAAHQAAKYDRSQIRIVAALTLRCNLKCEYCYQGHAKPTVMMSFETVDRLLRYIETRIARDHPQAIVVGIYGGEPLLAPEVGGYLMRSVLDVAEGKGIHVELPLITNGYLLESSRDKDIVRLATSVHLTLDGDKDAHDSVRCTCDQGPTFDRILGGMKYLLGIRKKIIVRIHASSLTFERLRSLLDRLYDCGLRPDSDAVLYLMSVEQGCESAMVVSCGVNNIVLDTREEISRIAKIISDATAHPLGALLYRQFHSPNRNLGRHVLACDYQADSVLALNCDGGVMVCPRHIGGNRHNQIAAIDDDGELKTAAIRSKIVDECRHRNAICRCCQFLPLCGGPCLLKQIPRVEADCVHRKTEFLWMVEALVANRLEGALE